MALAAELSDDENDAIALASTAAVMMPMTPTGNWLTMNKPKHGIVGRLRRHDKDASRGGRPQVPDQ